jgi:hypothetical protein
MRSLYLHSAVFRAIHTTHLHDRLDENLVKFHNHESCLSNEEAGLRPGRWFWRKLAKRTLNTINPRPVLRITSVRIVYYWLQVKPILIVHSKLQFLETLNIIRFGDAATLHIDSVIAGFWRYRHDTGAIAENDIADYLDLFIYLFLRPLRQTLRTLELDDVINPLGDLLRSSYLGITLTTHREVFGMNRAQKARIHEFVSHDMIANQDTAAAYLLFRINRGRFVNPPDNSTVALSFVSPSNFPELPLDIINSLCSKLPNSSLLRDYLEQTESAPDALHKAMRLVESHRKACMYRRLERCRELQGTQPRLSRLTHAWNEVLYIRKLRQQFVSDYSKSPEITVEVAASTPLLLPVESAIPSAEKEEKSSAKDLLDGEDSSSTSFDFPSPEQTGETPLKEQSMSPTHLINCLRGRLRNASPVERKIKDVQGAMRRIDSEIRRIESHQADICYRSAGERRRSKPPLEHRKILLNKNKRVVQELHERLIRQQERERQDIPEAAEATKLPDALERSIAKAGARLATDYQWLQGCAKNLKIPQIRELLKFVLPTLKLTYLRCKRRGPHSDLRHVLLSVKEYQRLEKDVQAYYGLPEKLVDIDAQPNRFTGIHHATLADELVALKRWRQNEGDHNATLRAQYHQETVTGDDRSSSILSRRLTTSNLMLKIADRDLGKLTTAKRYNSEDVKETQLFDDMKELPGTLGSRSYSEDIQMPHSSPPFLPSKVVYYVFEDILDYLKTIAFRFGRTEFPKIMVGNDWDCPETVPIYDFLKVLIRHKNFKEHLVLFEEEFMSVYRMRNAVAHGITDHDVDQVEELLVDACVVAEILGSRTSEDYIAPHQTLLRDYKQKVISQRYLLRQTTKTRLEESDLKFQCQKDQLVQEKAKVRKRPGTFARRSAALRRKFSHEKALLQREGILKERHLLVEASEPFKEFLIERRMRRLMDLVPMKRRQHLARALLAEYTSDQDRSELPEAYTKDHKVTDTLLRSSESGINIASTTLSGEDLSDASRLLSRIDAEPDATLDSDEYAEALVIAARPGGISASNKHSTTRSQRNDSSHKTDKFSPGNDEASLQDPSFNFLQEVDNQNSNSAEDTSNLYAPQPGCRSEQEEPVMAYYQPNTFASRNPEELMLFEMSITPPKTSTKTDITNKETKPSQPESTKHPIRKDNSDSPPEPRMPAGVFRDVSVPSSPRHHHLRFRNMGSRITRKWRKAYGNKTRENAFDTGIHNPGATPKFDKHSQTDEKHKRMLRQIDEALSGLHMTGSHSAKAPVRKRTTSMGRGKGRR